MSEWRATAVKIAQVELRAEHENGIVTTDLRLTTASE